MKKKRTFQEEYNEVKELRIKLNRMTSFFHTKNKEWFNGISILIGRRINNGLLKGQLESYFEQFQKEVLSQLKFNEVTKKDQRKARFFLRRYIKELRKKEKELRYKIRDRDQKGYKLAV